MRRSHRRPLAALSLATGMALVACAGPSPAPRLTATSPTSTSTTDTSPTSTSPVRPSTTTSRSGPAPTDTGPAPRPSPSAPPAPSPEKAGEVRVAFVGDIMLARTIGDRVRERGPDIVFAGVLPELTSADLTVGNLETTIGVGGTPQGKAFTFMAPPEVLPALTGAGFDLVSVANNHTYDFGARGLRGTLARLDAAGLKHVGAGKDHAAAHRPVVLEANGQRIAFLAYVTVPDDATGYRNRDWAATADRAGVAWADPKAIAQDVTRVRARRGGDGVDAVVVLLHAGTELSTQPDATQRAAAEAAFQAGAQAVIGAHPHVLQSADLSDGQLVAWSLGNFVFDGWREGAPTRSAILTVTFDDGAVRSFDWTPVGVVRGLPRALDPSSGEGAAILALLDDLPR